MNIFIICIVIFSLILIGSILLLLYFIKDEKNIKEVTNDTLIKMGKVYTKNEFEDKMFEQYSNILLNVEYEYYAYLKDACSDDVYNQILMQVKQNRERQEHDIIRDIKKEFCRLVSLEYVDNLEVAKFWVNYSSIEYITANRKQVLEDGSESLVETVISGSKDSSINHEYILTFVREKSQNEDIVCPNCGYQAHMLTLSKCIRCDLEIVPKKSHWVFIGKVSTNLSKNK